MRLLILCLLVLMSSQAASALETTTGVDLAAKRDLTLQHVKVATHYLEVARRYEAGGSFLFAVSLAAPVGLALLLSNSPVVGSVLFGVGSLAGILGPVTFGAGLSARAGMEALNLELSRPSASIGWGLWATGMTATAIAGICMFIGIGGAGATDSGRGGSSISAFFVAFFMFGLGAVLNPIALLMFLHDGAATQTQLAQAIDTASTPPPITLRPAPRTFDVSYAF
jgi:hypothetical protein